VKTNPALDAALEKIVAAMADVDFDGLFATMLDDFDELFATETEDDNA